MTTRLIPQCALCAHFKSPIGTGSEARTCAAFPDGIPDDIWSGRADHRQPHDGDRDVRWAPVGEGVTFPEFAMISQN